MRNVALAQKFWSQQIYALNSMMMLITAKFPVNISMEFMLVKQIVWEIMDVIYLAQDSDEAISCEYGNELSGSEK
jgi:hypothetical protein